MRVVQRRDVLDQCFLEVEIVRVVDPLQPGSESQQIESNGVAFPFVGRIVLRVKGRELSEIGNPLIRG